MGWHRNSCGVADQGCAGTFNLLKNVTFRNVNNLFKIIFFYLHFVFLIWSFVRFLCQLLCLLFWFSHPLSTNFTEYLIERLFFRKAFGFQSTFHTSQPKFGYLKFIVRFGAFSALCFYWGINRFFWFFGSHVGVKGRTSHFLFHTLFTAQFGHVGFRDYLLGLFTHLNGFQFDLLVFGKSFHQEQDTRRPTLSTELNSFIPGQDSNGGGFASPQIPTPEPRAHAPSTDAFKSHFPARALELFRNHKQ